MSKKQDLSSLIQKAKQKEVKPKKQEIKPKKESVLKDEKLFSLYMPENILVELKVLAAREGTSIKDLINSAVIEKYNL